MTTTDLELFERIWDAIKDYEYPGSWHLAANTETSRSVAGDGTQLSITVHHTTPAGEAVETPPYIRTITSKKHGIQVTSHGALDYAGELVGKIVNQTITFEKGDNAALATLTAATERRARLDKITRELKSLRKEITEREGKAARLEAEAKDLRSAPPLKV